MNREKTRNTAAIDTEIDAVLVGEEPLIPSSGFLASVMESVQREAAAPPLIPFPWKRAVPGILLAAGVFGWGGFKLFHLGLQGIDLSVQNSFIQPPMHLSPTLVAPVEQAGWVALALGLSLLSWLFSRLLAGRGGLL